MNLDTKRSVVQLSVLDKFFMCLDKRLTGIIELSEFKFDVAKRHAALLRYKKAARISFKYANKLLSSNKNEEMRILAKQMLLFAEKYYGKANKPEKLKQVRNKLEYVKDINLTGEQMEDVYQNNLYRKY